MFRPLTNPVVTGVAGVAVTGLALGGVAHAGGDHDRDGRHHGDVLRSKTVYMDDDGDVVKKMMQNGRVAAIDADSVLVRSKDGYAKTYRLRQATDYDFCARDREDEVEVGDLVTVHAKKKNGKAVATLIDQRTNKDVAGHKKKRHSHGGWDGKHDDDRRRGDDDRKRR